MKKVFVFPAIVLSLFWLCPGSAAQAADLSQGKEAFVQHCAECHPNGENMINPAKTLHRKDLVANGLAKPADIVGQMRNPGPGMPKFDAKTIPDEKARAIAEYILKTF
ncbi:MAG TPA: c-type cytochrome [Syntrophales bacterium]|nr:c-type cytochrome [Syntrophales bacterium]